MLLDSHKRILRNTGMLYMRMLLVMAVTLYTSRVVLVALGVEDFGIYHVVAGFVALLGFMQGAMTTATQRYFAFDLGETDGKDLSRILSTSLLIHGLLAVLIVFLSETAGYWFVATQLTIPDDRMVSALWAYHLAVAAFSITVVTVPFTAMLIAHERMGVFAVIGMVDVLLKLLAVILLTHVDGDRLVAYAFLLLFVNVTTLLLYVASNKLLFPKIRMRLYWHSQQFRTMLSYTAWNTWGNLASALSGQGSNVLLNIFFGPAVNAGKSISVQANGALTAFVSNVQAAINPQIIKLYASGEREKMHSLVLYASKYNFFILFTLALPVFLNTEALLGIWLVETPPYAAIFLQLTIVVSLVGALSEPLRTSAQATGVIRLYQAVIGGIQLLTAPICYVVLLNWEKAELVLVVTIVTSILAFIARLIILKGLTNLNVRSYVEKVLVRVLGTATVVIVIVTGIGLPVAYGIGQLIINAGLSVLIAGIGVFFLGLNGEERERTIYVVKMIKDRFR